jgi:hypothetical protein
MMAKKRLPGDIETRAKRFPNDQLEGMGSTALYPNSTMTNHGEKIGTSKIPVPGDRPNFMHDTHSGPGRRGRK